MNFVESLRMFHVDAKEIPCVTEKGAPTEKTLGAPGVLYMDTDTGDLYKCRAADAVNKVYTWEKIGGGSSDYKLPIGGEKLGGVKNGGNVTINADGTMTAPGSGSSQKAELFNKSDLPLGNQSFVTVDGVEYYRYNAGATNFEWNNPKPQKGAVTITARGVSQYGGTGSTRLKTVYDDGTSGPELRIVVSGESRTVTVTTDENKTLAKITGNYDLENWVLLDMSVMSVKAEYAVSGGNDGFSPIATVTQTEDGATITITDKTGTTTATVTNGKDGQPGEPGITPHIGANSNWWIGETDTGVSATGSGSGSGGSGESQKWVKIHEIETTEDVKNLEVKFPDTPMEEIKISLETLAADADTNYASIQIYTASDGIGTFHSKAWYIKPVPTTKAAVSLLSIRALEGADGNGMEFENIYNESHTYPFKGIAGKTYGFNFVDAYGKALNPYVTGFNVGTYGTFVAGTKMTVWGVAK